MIDLDALEALAEKATHGPWTLQQSGAIGPFPILTILAGRPGDQILVTGDALEDDARFIAALDPSTVRELIRLSRLALRVSDSDAGPWVGSIPAAALLALRNVLGPPCRWCGQPKSVHGTDGRLLPDGCEWDMQTTFYAP